MNRKSYARGGLIAGAIVIGVGLLIHFGIAAIGRVGLEAEAGTASGNAKTINDTSASGGKAASFAAASTPPPSDGSVLPLGYGKSNGPSGTFNLKLNDNFDGTTLDSNVWSTGWNGVGTTYPVQSQETACYLPSQVTLNGGILHLKAVRQDTTCSKGTNPHPYASGAINSKTKREYSLGFFEARLKLPASAGGVVYNWPAWWLDCVGTWPDGGEIDVMEGLNGVPKASYHGPVNNGANVHLATAPSGTDYTQFHTYAVEWGPSTLTVYYDGVKLGSYTSSTNVVPDKKFLILGNQMSPEGKYGGPVMAPADMQVDYVRVWQR